MRYVWIIASSQVAKSMNLSKISTIQYSITYIKLNMSQKIILLFTSIRSRLFLRGVGRGPSKLRP